MEKPDPNAEQGTTGEEADQSVEEFDRDLEEDPSTAHPLGDDPPEYDRLRGG